MLQTAARLLVEEHVGGTPTDVDVIDWGNQKRIAIVHREDDETVVVCQESSVLHEALVSECIRQSDSVPVPEVLWADPEGDTTTFPTYIQQYVDGSFLPPTTEAYEELGRVIGRLHEAMPANHAGSIEYESGELTVNRGTWPETFKQVIERIDDMTGNNVPEPVVEAVRAYISENDHLLDGRPIALCHQDMHPHNIIADGEEIVAIVDWDRAAYQDPEADLALTEYLACDVYIDDDELRAACRTALYEGYESVRPISERYFTGRRSLYRLPSLLWATYQHLPDSRTHDVEPVAEELQLLLDDYLDDNIEVSPRTSEDI